MQWKHGWRRMTRLWQSETARHVDDELQFHFEQKVSEFEANGLSKDAAIARAREEFGDVEDVRKSLRTIDKRILSRKRRIDWWESVAQDTRYVIRSLRKSPAFALMVVVTLSLGLGANSALFAVIDKLYVQMPQGVRDASKVQRVYVTDGDGNTRSLFNYAQLRSLAEVAPAGMEIAGYSVRGLPPWTLANVRSVAAAYVVGDYFGVLGVHPALGRFFDRDERQIGGLSLTAVISYDYWNRQFARDPAVLGQIVSIGAHKHRIIGVAPAGFRGLDVNNVDVWVPQNSQGILRERSTNWFEEGRYLRMHTLRVIARTPSEPATTLFNARATELLRNDPESSDTHSRTYLGSLLQSRVDGSQSSQLKTSTRLAGVSIFILLIAAANVVNLLLARSSSREREIAVRLALGIGRKRLVSQLITESLVLGLSASVIAMLVSYVGANFLQRMLFPSARMVTSGVDARTMAYTTAVAIAVSLCTGLIPALQFSKPQLSRALRSNIRDGGRANSAVRTSMLIAQVALSIILLAGAGVFVRSMRNVESIDLGFDADRILFAQVDHNPEEGDRGEELERRLPELAERARGIPGVESVALSDGILFLQGTGGVVILPDRDSAETAKSDGNIRSVVSPEYFRTIGVRTISGRVFTESDRIGAEPVIVINEPMAQRLWPGQDAVNRCVIVDKRNSACRRVVGVVAATRDEGVVAEAPQKFYLPLAQVFPNETAAAIVIRAPTERMSAIQLAVSRETSTMFGSVGSASFETVDLRVRIDMQSWRIAAALFGAAGLLALLVAAVGVYSSVAYNVSQRRQEMGVRVALGANAGSIIGLVVRQGVGVVAIGVVIGSLMAVALGSIVATMLYNVSPRDPIVLVGSAVILSLVAAGACAIPAWRASRVDPLSALRAE